ncbi:hypothetical protein WUBG_13396, partial [Wuchereria bancrofti]
YKCEYGSSDPAGPKGRNGKNDVDGLPGSNGIPGIDDDVIVTKGTDFCFECPPGMITKIALFSNLLFI